MRTVREIASEIRKEWENVNFAAKPYLAAMLELETVQDRYGLDTGHSIVIHFLCNASSFRGEAARRIKKELKDLVK
jgi:hypothetical protein